MQLDPEFTAQLETWLSTPRDERDVVAGAELLYRITGNRRFLNQAIVRPSSVHDHIEADLRKHLDIRESGHNPQTLHQLERKLLKEVEELESPERLEQLDSLENLDPLESPESHRVKRGRRPDHELLAPEVQSIVEENARRYEHMRTLYNRLVSMADAEPCDRHEDILQLDRLYKAWGEAWAVYDAAQPEEESHEPSPASPSSIASSASEPSPLETAQKIAAAKRYLQKHRKKLRTLQESKDASDAVRAAIEHEAQLIAEKESELTQLTNA